ncbi:MAG: type III-A CRISPR-associated RAMP protein Csm5 [Armatimonadota bacterium]|nr:type III-A CRISPR-associated RAMP protein Csm5 [Armatimonadota bacterium]
MRKLYEEYVMSITPLTPIHIGSGETLMPGDYFIFREDGSYALYAIDIGYLSSKLSKGRDVLCKWVLDDPIGWVKKASKNTKFTALVKKHARFCSLVSDAVAEGITSRWGQGTSMLEISTFQRSGRTLVVPGASIKGALRTALLYRAVQKPLQVPDSTKQQDVSRWERKVLGSKSDSIQDDILRHLRISDASAEDLQTVVLNVEHVGMRTQSGEQAQLTDYRECLPGALQPGFERGTLRAVFQISSGHPHYAQCRGELTRQLILDACRLFYGDVIRAEREYWRGNQKVLQLYDELSKEMEASPESAPIRLGWGVGMGAIGLNLAKREGKHPRGRIDPRYRYSPRTRRIMDGLYPPGWAIFTLEAI